MSGLKKNLSKSELILIAEEWEKTSKSNAVRKVETLSIYLGVPFGHNIDKKGRMG